LHQISIPDFGGIEATEGGGSMGSADPLPTVTQNRLHKITTNVTTICNFCPARNTLNVFASRTLPWHGRRQMGTGGSCPTCPPLCPIAASQDKF